jgi:hypothetical protein
MAMVVVSVHLYTIIGPIPPFQVITSDTISMTRGHPPKVQGSKNKMKVKGAKWDGTI